MRAGDPTARVRRDKGFGGSVGRGMLRGIEDALWLPAWANAAEEEGVRLPRNITRETADDMPASVRVLARRFASLLVKLNRATLTEIHRRASAAEGRSVDPEELGYYLTMPALGHGVSWTDSHRSFDVVLPSGEVYALPAGRGRWRLEGYVSDRFARPLRDPRRGVGRSSPRRRTTRRR